MASVIEAGSLLQSAFLQLDVLYKAPESLGVLDESGALLNECFAIKKVHKLRSLNSEELSRLRRIVAECGGLAAELAIKNYEKALEAVALAEAMPASSGALFVFRNVLIRWSPTLV